VKVVDIVDTFRLQVSCLSLVYHVYTVCTFSLC
jgi:hypothetical protein